VPAPGVLANDTDPDGLPMTASLVSGPAHGSLTLNADGSFSYTPQTGFTGVDGFAYTATDGELSTGNVPVSIGVTGAPMSVGSARLLPGGTPVLIEDAVVTATGFESGSVFVESPDRSAGIKLITSQSLTLGQKTEFAGVVGRMDGEYQISNVSFRSITAGSVIAPVWMSTRGIGNDRTESLNYAGINTTGMLVRVAGRLTSVVKAQNVGYLDDGAGYQDGIGPSLGMLIHFPAGVTRSVNSNVIITGISRVEKHTPTHPSIVNGATYPAGTVIYVPSVWPRDSNDVGPR